MPDIFDKAKRSEVMKKITAKNNKSTECKLISYFHEWNIIGWRRNYKVKGHPDFIFSKKKVAIFVDGCFWHGHDCRNTRPMENKAFWEQKRAYSKRHDQEVTAHLERLGWRVIRIWECELKKSNQAILLERISFLQNDKV